MRSGPFEPRILSEFRDAVDNVRKTAWAVQEWQERQSRQQDPLTVLPLLTAEGIRRATQLCEAITTGLAAHEVARGTAGGHEIFPAGVSLHQSRIALFRGPPSLPPESNRSTPGGCHMAAATVFHG